MFFSVKRKDVIRTSFVEKQGGFCPLCRKLFTEDLRPSLDHCHTTDRCRAALCGECNHGLGCFKDNPEALLRAAQYVQQDYSSNPFYPGTEEDRASFIIEDLEAAL